MLLKCTKVHSGWGLTQTAGITIWQSWWHTVCRSGTRWSFGPIWLPSKSQRHTAPIADSHVQSKTQKLQSNGSVVQPDTLSLPRQPPQFSSVWFRAYFRSSIPCKGKAEEKSRKGQMLHLHWDPSLIGKNCPWSIIASKFYLQMWKRVWDKDKIETPRI